jgi:hypothetical protein
MQKRHWIQNCPQQWAASRSKLHHKHEDRMPYSLTWLRQVLLDAGLRVAEQPGWIDRGHGDIGPIKGVICHHTAGPATGNMPSLGVVTNGRPDLSGPLAQICLGRDGTFYIVAAGKCYHAGAGSWRGITTGNTNFIGIEAENTGLASDPWPHAQMVAYQHGVAAILRYAGADVGMCCGHKEYALPKGRKDDPSFDMDQFRTDVAKVMSGQSAPPAPVAANAGQATLKRNDTGLAVDQLQQLLKPPQTGTFDGDTEAAMRQVQLSFGLTPDGIVGPRTWLALTAMAPATSDLDAITAIAAASSARDYDWHDRGIAPVGYIKGMAVMFARLYCKLSANDPAASEMAKPIGNDPKNDSLALYAKKFADAGLGNAPTKTDVLRHLLVLMFGVGMLESSGNLGCGRDKSANNTDADTCEAGLFQTSYNARSYSPAFLDGLIASYANSTDFKSIFSEDAHSTADDAKNWGAGPGVDFQALSKNCPAFEVEFTALAMRNTSRHWGTVSSMKTEIRPECDALLKAIQKLVDDRHIVSI